MKSPTHTVGIPADPLIQVGEVSAGPVTASLGLGLDTSVKVGQDSVSVNVLGTGIQIGRIIKISLFGSTIAVKIP
ncbi:unnamed protein product [Adineta ricciae]|uniref:Uncharacterized protein n=1 Tax=Adineta ricciae TaxID=249248 RepID=A0A815L151_ADIRI|nr:unnamed protein product [Adineta ricciae]CAF1403771.1 unnamed protein product [Adineta ricciae]